MSIRCATRRVSLALSAGALALLFVLTAAVPAFAASVLQGTTFTLNQTSGGKPTRFTLATVPTQQLDSITIGFPQGFDLTKSRIDVVTLDGLQRIPIKATQSIDGQNVKLVFTPAMSTGFELRVQVFDVLLPRTGGQYNAKLDFVSNGVAGTTTTPPFSFETYTVQQGISDWLDAQSWVKAWNSVKFFNLFLQPQMIVTSTPVLFTGWLMSIALVSVAFPFAISGGLLLAFMKMSKVWPVRFVANFYINVIRGTPLFLQIFIAFVGLPIAGLVGVPLFPTGVIVLALNSSAYLAEIFRAGIQSISKGQFEAASSLGMSYPKSMAYVIIPQTVKRVLPTMTSEFILLFKDTALLSAVGVFELMLYGNTIATRSGSLTPFMVAAVYYLIVTVPLIKWVSNLELRLAISEGGQAASDNPGGRRRRRWLPASAGAEAVRQASVAEHESR